MIFILYSETNDASVRDRLGQPEYSYYFVLKEFRRVLPRLGEVVVVQQPHTEVDPIYDQALARGESCVFLCFAPPPYVPHGLRCPTVPVFAWEFSTLPDENWCEDEDDWREGLRRCGRAITHSVFAAEVVRRTMGADYPVASIPAPTWDRFRAAAPAEAPPLGRRRLHLQGRLVDSLTLRPAVYEPPPAPVLPEPTPIERGELAPAYRLAVSKRYFVQWYREVVLTLLPAPLAAALRGIAHALGDVPRRLRGQPGWAAQAAARAAAEQAARRAQAEAAEQARLALLQPFECELSGVVYTCVLNPCDGRKNWHDMLTAFCFAFREVEDATLILKLTHSDFQTAVEAPINVVRRLLPMRCRVLLLHGYLDDAAYAGLLAATSYGVNTAHGEGQCLPLMEYMAAGKPAIAPAHSSMADYVDTSNAFVLRASTEPTIWPKDPRLMFRTLRYRLDWESLVTAFRDSYRVAHEDPERYRTMAIAARERLRAHSSEAVFVERLRAFLDLPEQDPALQRAERVA